VSICDYEGSPYQSEFWGEGRQYEDLAERIALRRLLPPTGHRLVEVGAGFGRVADLYEGYEQIILLDPAMSMLRQAQDRWEHDPRFMFVRALVGNLPLADSMCDTLVMVRVMHHLVDVPGSLAELSRVLGSDGTFVCECANKRNLKAMLRYVLRCQKWCPFHPDPVEFGPAYYNYHPRWMHQRFLDAGLQCEKRLAVSLFRTPWLKRTIPPEILAAVDGLLQVPGALYPLTPSLFVRASHISRTEEAVPVMPFRCPDCGNRDLKERDSALDCDSCGRSWPIDDGVYDFGGPPEQIAIPSSQISV
jgi:SAM-dependent methyltransferase